MSRPIPTCLAEAKKGLRGIPSRRCALRSCRRFGHPRRWADYFNAGWCCSRSCASRRLYARRRAELSAGTSARNRRLARQKVEAAVGRKYGELSVRDIELFNLGVRVGWNHGYRKGLDTSAQKKDAAA